MTRYQAAIFPRRRRACRRLLAACLAAMAVATAPAAAIAGNAPVPPPSRRAPQIRLSGERITLPIVMVEEYPFVEGSVAGVSGKLMLDTGAEQALAINDRRVPVSGARTIGTGRFGSGQTFVTRLAPELRGIRIGNLVFPRATMVQTQDARQLEAITPDFLGWIGYDAWAGYALKLDYRRARATFCKGGAEACLHGERILAILPFATRKLPNHPLMAARIGTMPVVAAWDSGQYGALFTSDAGKAKLVREGRLTPSRKEPDAFDLSGLTLDGHAMPGIPAIQVETTAFPAASPIGTGHADVLTLGFGMLHRYKTVWDYRQRRIYLLAP